MKRVGLADVARHAGVSKGSASVALNGLPGVSESTRERVRRAAEELGWTPHAAARALAGGTSGAIAVVMNRPPGLRGVEPLLQHYLEGVQDELVDRAASLLIKVVGGHRAELETYQEWAAQRRVDGVVLLDLRADDDRPQVLRGLGLPSVGMGAAEFAAGMPTVWTDDDATARQLVEYLSELGHRHLARIGGAPQGAHTVIRDRALRAACAAAGLPEPVVLSAADRQAAQDLTRALLDAETRPSALLYENDVLAMVGLAVTAERGLRVPTDLSMIAWDDSGIGHLTVPALTTVDHDAHAQAGQAVRLLLRVLEGQPADSEQAPTPGLLLRASTGPVGGVRG